MQSTVTAFVEPDGRLWRADVITRDPSQGGFAFDQVISVEFQNNKTLEAPDAGGIDPDQRRALGHQPVRTSASQERRVDDVLRSAEPLSIPGMQQHGFAAYVVSQQCLDVDPSHRRTHHSHHHSLEVGELVQRHARQVIAVSKPMDRGVDVGPGVGDHRDPADLEGGALGVRCLGRLTRQVQRDLRPWQTRQRDHPRADPVTELDESPPPPDEAAAGASDGPPRVPLCGSSTISDDDSQTSSAISRPSDLTNSCPTSSRLASGPDTSSRKPSTAIEPPLLNRISPSTTALC